MAESCPTQLELSAITHALAGPEAWKRQLLAQTGKLIVVSREDTGAGFYTYFCESPDWMPVVIPAEAYSIPPQCFAYHTEILGGAIFLVWLKGGRIDCLEGATGVSGVHDESGFVFERELKIPASD